MPSLGSYRRFRAVSLVALLVLFVAASPRASTYINLGFGSLPSAQGWTFGTGGSPLATEAGTWSLGAGVLTLNTMAYGTVSPGTSAYYVYTGVVNNFEPVVIRMRARLLQHEGDFSNSFVGNGFCFGFTQGTTQWLMGITPAQIRNVNGTVLSTAFDNTQFHDYRLEWSPPSSVRYYVDNVLISTNSAGIGQLVNRVIFGDGTGAANCAAEITSFEFLQGGAVTTETSTWGRVKALYH